MAPPEPEPVDCGTYTIVYLERYCVGDYCTPWTESDRETYPLFCTGGSSDGNDGGIVYTQHDEPKPVPSNPNQNIIDSLKNYPCAQEILKQLPSINAEVDSIIQKIFGLNEDVNLTFSVDNKLDGNSSVMGITKATIIAHSDLVGL